MSYGLPRAPICSALKEGRHVLGLINLGNVVQARRACPASVTVLLDAPIEVLRSRLLARGGHDDGQISERLRNAGTVSTHMSYYDYVIRNDQPLQAAAADLEKIMDAYTFSTP